MKKDLKNILLLNGGCNVIFGCDTENEIKNLISKGKIFSKLNLKFYKKGMKPNQCHRNSSILYLTKKSYKLVTGYAMYNGEWLSHSWLFNGKNIIETCPIVFEEYFGVELVGLDLDNFLIEN